MSSRCIVYIDAANLYEGIRSSGWKMDYQRFYVWLKDKYQAERAYLFIGLVPGNNSLYTRLQEIGYILVYKETTYDGSGRVKGSCDADLVLKVMDDFHESRFDQTVIVTSDGDYASLIKFLHERKALKMLISPRNTCSYLLRKLYIPILFLETQKERLSFC